MSPEAKREVEQHEGVAGVREELQLERSRALSRDATATLENKHNLRHERRDLEKRAVEWVKQTNADKALVMNSQYK